MTMPSRQDINQSGRSPSWPPTRVRLTPVVALDREVSPFDMDRNPCRFITSASTHAEYNDYDHEFDDVDMLDLDAGIQDVNNPRRTVRSVSPSTLDGLRRRTSPRSASPDPESEVVTPDSYDGGDGNDDNDDDNDNDDEAYIRFAPRGLGLGIPFHHHDFSLPSGRTLRRMKKTRNLVPARASPPRNRSPDALLSPLPQEQQPAVGGSRGRGAGHGRQMSGHLWREPSPDVWSIEEEAEDAAAAAAAAETASIDVCDDRTKTEKPKKRVRFVLPATEGQGDANRQMHETEWHVTQDHDNQ